MAVAATQTYDHVLVEMSELEEAIEEVESGKVVHCSSLEELKMAIG